MPKVFGGVFFAVTILILALLQVGVFPAIFGEYPCFNLFLCLVVGLVFRGYFSKSLWVAFLGGVFLDFFTFFPFGLTSLILVVFSCLCRKIYGILGFRWWVLVVVSFGFSFLIRLAFNFFSFSWLYLLGAAEDVLLSSLFYLFLTSVWERVFCDEHQISLG